MWDCLKKGAGMRDQLLPPPPPPGSSASKLSGALWRRGGKEGVLAKLNSASTASKLSGALWRRGGKEGVLAKLNSASNSPVAPRQLSCQISANQREARTSANVNKH